MAATRRGLLREHSYKPRPFFRTIPGEAIKDTLFFGFELETENILNRHTQDDHILWSQKFWEDKGCGKFCYYKWDGSLHNGIEIVSHPMSWAWFQKNKPYFTEYLAGLRSRGLALVQHRYMRPSHPHEQGRLLRHPAL
ncbi:MAG: hypothetical protein MZV49_24130 [Rhodopseudomonas palustris]|nr:hypothetical protein [Rhodopseudomonas palustris]